MYSQSFLFQKILVFLAIFLCLPLPHGNIYPFVGLVGLCLFQFKKQDLCNKITNPLLIIFIAWCTLSMLWAPTPKVLHTYGKVMTIMLGGWFWSNSYRNFNLQKREQIQTIVSAAGLLLAIFLVIFAISLKFGWQLHAVIDERVSQALVHGCIACSLAIWMQLGTNNLQHFKKWIQASILIILFWTMQRCSSDTAALGILIGSAALVMHKFLPRFLRTMFIYGMPTVWGVLPFVFRILTPEQYTQWSTTLDPSHTHRLFIWHSVTKQVFERFWTGFGIGSSRYRFLCVDGKDITIINGHEKLVLFSPENCLHPHNFMLQMWLELGAIGVALACLTWIVYWRNTYATSTSYTIAFFGTALCIATTGISVWQSWWLILLMVLMPVYKEQRID